MAENFLTPPEPLNEPPGTLNTPTGHDPDADFCEHCGCGTSQRPGGPGPYTHIVKRASGYIAGWFVGEPPAEYVTECNTNVPGDPAHVEAVPEWPVCQAHNQAIPCPDCPGGVDERDPATAGVVGAPQPARARDARCWQDFCTATDCDGLHHIDTTGYSWTQRRGTRYCAPCGGYVDRGCGHDELVTTLYEAAGTPESERELQDAMGAPYAANTPEYRTWGVAQHRGRAAASWVIEPSMSQETLRAIIRGIADGDPAVLDSIREPSLSGEFAGDYSEDDLMADVGWVPHDGTMHRDDLATQYNQEVTTAFWHEVERLANRAFSHRQVDERVQLGNRFLTCSCGHTESGGAYDNIAARNMAYHLNTVAK